MSLPKNYYTYNTSFHLGEEVELNFGESGKLTIPAIINGFSYIDGEMKYSLLIVLEHTKISGFQDDPIYTKIDNVSENVIYKTKSDIREPKGRLEFWKESYLEFRNKLKQKNNIM